VFTRDGLEPTSELISGARVLRVTALLATVISVMSAILGALLTVFLCWLGAYRAASAGNLLLFMGSMLIAAMLVCGFAKFKK
jgi:hypothetical protein